MLKRRRLITLAVTIIAVLIIAYFAVYLPLEHNQDNGGQSTSPSRNNPTGYQTFLNKVFEVSKGRVLNYSLDLGSYSNISAIALYAYSNQTPANLNLNGSGKLFDQISLPDQNNAFTSGITYADPPYVNLYGGIWYLNIYNLNVSGQIHVIVSFKPP